VHGPGARGWELRRRAALAPRAWLRLVPSLAPPGAGVARILAANMLTVQHVHQGAAFPGRAAALISP
jgi:hypothetical protein